MDRCDPRLSCPSAIQPSCIHTAARKSSPSKARSMALRPSMCPQPWVLMWSSIRGIVASEMDCCCRVGKKREGGLWLREGGGAMLWFHRKFFLYYFFFFFFAPERVRERNDRKVLTSCWVRIVNFQLWVSYSRWWMLEKLNFLLNAIEIKHAIDIYYEMLLNFLWIGQMVAL